MQGAEELILDFYNFSKCQRIYTKLLPHLPNISKGMRDGDQQITFNLENAGKQEVRLSIIHCSCHGCYNFANSYFRMIDKTQLI